MNKYICIHGHFYQPPRENPWLETIELQDSAYPYHDWNEKITAECYAPNSAARILNESGNIIDIMNNYQYISFNFGPTLMSWIKENDPSLLETILDADKKSQKQFDGHGAAIAQAYNHMILPLANSKDKYTQILWGIKDFEHYFQRKPEGLWLPETAVDLESLDIMADLGIKFTILAPHQAKRFKNLNSNDWIETKNQSLDTNQPYIQKLPSGRSIVIFFYIGQASQSVAFGNLLDKGEVFAEHLNELFSNDSDNAQLVHIATDGETYGHHHSHGDMALAYALEYFKKTKLANLAIYGQFLEKYPPTLEVDIYENSSWSCAHGIERWKSNCGCNLGGGMVNQEWRRPLRQGLDWLRDSLSSSFQEQVKKFFHDPWEARNNYITVIHDRSSEVIEQFLANHSHTQIDCNNKIKILKWFELQRNMLLAYTSCGWFFNEISGIETIQVLKYASHVIQLAKELTYNDFEPIFLSYLENAPSNIPHLKNGANVFKKYAKPAQVELSIVAAHYAITCLFFDCEAQTQIYCYEVNRSFENYEETGKVRLLLGTAKFTSRINGESETMDYGVIYYGEHNLNCAVRHHKSQGAFKEMQKSIMDNFSQGNYLDIIKLFDQHFAESNFSLKNLFRDEQIKIINLILESTVQETELSSRKITDNYAPIVNFLQTLSLPIPKSLLMNIDFITNQDVKNAIQEENPDPEKILYLYEKLVQLKIEFDRIGSGFLFQKTIESYIQDVTSDTNIQKIQILVDLTNLINQIPLEINLWRSQNTLLNFKKTENFINSNSEFKKEFKKLCNNLKIECDL